MSIEHTIGGWLIQGVFRAIPMFFHIGRLKKGVMAQFYHCILILPPSLYYLCLHITTYDKIWLIDLLASLGLDFGIWQSTGLRFVKVGGHFRNKLICSKQHALLNEGILEPRGLVDWSRWRIWLIHQMRQPSWYLSLRVLMHRAKTEQYLMPWAIQQLHKSLSKNIFPPSSM